MDRPFVPTFRQACVLAMLAGACAVSDTALSVLAFAALVLLLGIGTLRRTAVLLLFFVFGAAMEHAALPRPEEVTGSSPDPMADVVVGGRIDSVSYLPGGRVRLILSGVSGGPASSWTVSSSSPRALRAGLARLAGGKDGFRLAGAAALSADAADAESCGTVEGGTVIVRARSFPVGGFSNPGLSGSEDYWRVRGVSHILRIRKRGGKPMLLAYDGKGVTRAAAMRDSARRALRSAAAAGTGDGVRPSRGGGLLPALIFGDRGAMDPRVSDLFTEAGLVHSLALSGQHLALAAAAGVLAARAAVMLFPALLLAVPFRLMALAAGMPLAMLYLYVGGTPFSLFRAAAMLAVAFVFIAGRRSFQPLDVLFAAAALLFLMWPPAVFDLSARLSVLAVAGILLSLPVCSWMHARIAPENIQGIGGFARRAAAWAADMLVVSAAAQAAVFPVLVDGFGTVSLSFWLNVIWLPLLSLLVLPLGALSACLAAAGAVDAASLAAAWAAWPADLMIGLLSSVRSAGWLWNVQFLRPPGLSLAGCELFLAGIAALMGRLILGKSGRKGGARRIGLACAAGMLCMTAGMAPAWWKSFSDERNGTVRLEMLDVGMGQALVLSYPGGRMLIDGGGSASPVFDPGRSIVAPVLTDGRLPRLDAVVVSHTDLDHARGLRWILEHFSVGALCWSEVSAGRASEGEGAVLRAIARRRGIPEVIWRKGESHRLAEELSLEVLSPDMDDPRTAGMSGNDASLALRLVRSGRGLALFCGDMEASALKRLAQSGQELGAEVLVLPHHGAASSRQPLLYDAVHPETALASAARWNHYGFPSRKVRDELERRGIRIVGTPDAGAVTVEWMKDGPMRLSTAR
ncbi:MAG: DNA internalization-related competence protein ComEC/Rec2 [Mailhella sp.]|nr:DNA internalization-related competence protein ComEC/Rec2 [Mailhella sp.]